MANSVTALPIKSHHVTWRWCKCDRMSPWLQCVSTIQGDVHTPCCWGTTETSHFSVTKLFPEPSNRIISAHAFLYTWSLKLHWIFHEKKKKEDYFVFLERMTIVTNVKSYTRRDFLTGFTTWSKGMFYSSEREHVWRCNLGRKIKRDQEMDEKTIQANLSR